jgi:DNA-binding winged helix-turn-helix (wHTH) protein/tetratricopeptide (TPR) repeat protein
MQDFGKFPKKVEKATRGLLYEFGNFRLNPQKRIVLREGELLPLTPKCFDLLLVLVERRNEVLVKEELMDLVWQDTAVEEGNLNRHVSTLRKVLGESPNDHRYIVTVPGRGYRFVAEVREVLDEPPAKIRRDAWAGGEAAEPARKVAGLQPVPAPELVKPMAAGVELRTARRWVWIATGMVVVVALVYVLGFRTKTTLTTNDLVLIGDFSNSTGDAVFDDTLKQALSVDLSQSPYLNILSDAKVHATLKLMTRSGDPKLTEEVAREVCQRAGGKAYISGSIGRLGSQYVVGLNAIDCATGDSLAREQVTAKSKEGVLNALDSAGTELRGKLGESLKTVREFDTPLVEATTASLEALKAYSQGMQKDEVNDAAAVPFFKRAIELDPEFASAYSGLAVCYKNLGESGLARENFAKAFELRGHVSEREKLLISARYYNHVTGELQKAIEAYQLWVQAYPRDAAAHGNLGGLYGASGQYEKSIEETKEALRLDPEGGANYSNLLLAQAAIEKLDDAAETFRQMQARKIEDPIARVNWFGVAFVRGDAAEMDKQMAWSAGKPEGEDNFLAAKSDAEAYYGRERKAREFSGKAVDSALRNEEKETAAQWRMDEALREAEFGNGKLAQEDTANARALTASHDTQILAAIALARTGRIVEAESLASDLEKRYPLDTLVEQYWIPVIRASIELQRNNPARAVELLRVTTPYELASPVTWSELGGPLYPAYLRGEAYLLLHRAEEAAAEYRKLIEHRGFMLACPLGALAHVGLGRALAASGETAKAQTAYQDFLALWKDADEDIPILKQAKTEYAKIR